MRDGLIYKLSLRTPCRWRTLGHVLTLLKVAMPLGLGGKAPDTQNLEKEMDVPVFLSALSLVLTLRKPCCCVSHWPGAPGGTLLRWWSSRGHFFGISYIG